MSADLLRRAAALMRERAEPFKDERWIAAGEWLAVETNGCNCAGGSVGSYAHEPSCGQEPLAHIGNREATQYIASWHPAVALAVADWLDLVARLLDEGSTSPAEPGSALAVARAYLDEPA
jgi:hypothetical protein